MASYSLLQEFRTPVFDQNDTCHCWVNNVTDNIKMQHMMVHGIQSPPTLSRQELVEFADEHPYPGCRGTNVGAAFQYIKKNGIYAEDCFPYMDGVRRSEENIPFPTGNDRYRIAGYITFSMQNYSDATLRDAVVKFPVVATLVIDHSFSSRFGRLSPWKGVTNYFSSHNSLHCVNVVGFNFVGDDQSQWYYEVKNTHGEDFGESGYTTIAPGLIIEFAFPIVRHSDDYWYKGLSPFHQKKLETIQP